MPKSGSPQLASGPGFPPEVPYCCSHFVRGRNFSSCRAAFSGSNSLQVEGCPSRVTTRELGSSKPAVSSPATSVGQRMSPLLSFLP